MFLYSNLNLKLLFEVLYNFELIIHILLLINMEYHNFLLNYLKLVLNFLLKTHVKKRLNLFVKIYLNFLMEILTQIHWKHRFGMSWVESCIIVGMKLIHRISSVFFFFTSETYCTSSLFCSKSCCSKSCCTKTCCST